MGSFLSSVVPPQLKLSGGFFLLALIYSPLYMGAALFTLSNWFFPTLFLIILPLHLFAGFCMLYTLYFVSKSLVLAKSGQSAPFHSYIGLFLLIWFFPIGVWIVQPRVNRLYAEKGMRPTL
jgi:hypothetical protein